MQIINAFYLYPGTCLQLAACILPPLLKALFINTVSIDLLSVNQRNLCASEITAFHRLVSGVIRRNCTTLLRTLP